MFLKMCHMSSKSSRLFDKLLWKKAYFLPPNTAKVL